ncbi:MAG: copper resistance protein CopC/CopD [Chloroflexi bacterium]|nr:copper resistance protein CopC/CopD [Chloroflexota bacterium]
MKRQPYAARTATRALLIVVLAVSLLWLLPAGLAYAHASLVSADPAPNSAVQQAPERVTVGFSEPLEAGFSDIRVLDAQGRRVDQGDSAVDSQRPTVMSVTLQPLPNGTYTVVWTTLSAVDGHLLRGSYVFHVGEAAPGPPPGEPAPSQPVAQPGEPLVQSRLEPVARWLVLLGGLALLGGLGFEVLVLRPPLAGADASKAVRRLRAPLSARSARLVWLAWGLFVAASVGQLLVQATVATGLPLLKVLGSPLVSILRNTTWGDVWTLRMEWLAVTAIVLIIKATSSPGEQGQKPALARLYVHALPMLSASGALFTLSWTSHGAAIPELRWQVVLSDYLHLLAASFWVGGLFHLALGLPLVLRTLPQRERGVFLAGIVPRFSAVAILSVGTLVVTGLYSGWAQVTVWRAVDTPYGLTLVAKVGLLVPLMALAALNLLWVRPRLAVESAAGRWLLRFVTGEALLAVVLLLSVGLLTSLEPAREVASRRVPTQPPGYSAQDVVDGTAIYLKVTPGWLGTNRFLVALEDRSGDPIANAEDVALRLTYLDADVEPTALSAANLTNGQYLIEGVQVSIAGAWEAALTIRRPDAFDTRAAFRFNIAASGATRASPIVLSPDTGRLLWALELALLGLLFLGTGVVIGGRSNRGGTVVMAVGAAAILIAMALLASR